MELEQSGQNASDPISTNQDFNDLISMEQKFLRSLIRMLGVPGSDVLDVLQEANLYMVRNQSSFVPGTNFRAWASQVTRYRILSYYRGLQRKKTVGISEDVMEMLVTEAPEHYEVVQPRMQRLRQCLQRLKPQQAQLLSAVYGMRKSLKDLAEDTGQSHSALRKTISRTRLILRECIENKPDE